MVVRKGVGKEGKLGNSKCCTDYQKDKTCGMTERRSKIIFSYVDETLLLG